MRLGNLLHFFVIIVLLRFINVEYQHSKNVIERELQYLRVQKSYQNRQSFESEYGPNWKQVIVQKTEENKQLLITLWNTTMYKILGVCVLLAISVIHIIRYFYIHYDDDNEWGTITRYDLQTWLINFCFLWIITGWCWVINQSVPIIIIGYVFALLSLTYSVELLSRDIWKKQLAKFTFLRFSQYFLGILLYLHLVGTYITGVFFLSTYIASFRIPH
jgi:hypothetical protein